MVAWTAKQALMLEMIWPLPCDVSVPVGVASVSRPASQLAAGCQQQQGGKTQGGGGATDPL